MKLMSVIGINLEITKWIVSEDKSPMDDEDNLCAYECRSLEAAKQMMENIKSAFKMDYSMDLDGAKQESLSLDYYLETHGNYVVTSMKFLERYFDGKVEDVDPKNQCINKSLLSNELMADEEDNSHPGYVIINTSKNSLVIKRISPEELEEADLIDFSEEYLGATSYTKRNKGGTAQIIEAYNFNGLYLPRDNFNILWLPAKPYQGRPMFTAYGCSSHKVAKILEAKIIEDEKKKQKGTPLVINNEHMTLACDGPILLASGDYLEQIYGKPTHVSLVNDLVKKGLADKLSKQRTIAVDKILGKWDEKIKLRNQTNLLKSQNRNTQTFFTSQFVPTAVHQNPVFAFPFNNKKTVVPMPAPLPYPTVFMEGETIVPKPDPLPLPFMLRQNAVATPEATKLVAPRTHSLFHDSNFDEPFKTFTEEEYLGLFQ